MAIFIAVPLIQNSSLLNQAVEKHIATHDRYKLQTERGWLIKYEGTTAELCTTIELTGQPSGQSSALGSAIIMPITGYYGRGPAEMWEWLKTRFEQQ